MSDATNFDHKRDIIEQAISGRRSVRAFLDRTVERFTIERILAVASRAPSGSNIQPWKVHVVQGATLATMKRELLALHDAGAPEAREYDYYPLEWRSPYQERRRKVGWDMFALAGIAKGDREGTHRQRGHNYTLFGAPVGLIFTIDADLGRGSWLDYGMFLENIMIAARGHGLETCPQAALANYPEPIRRLLSIPASEMLMCGMALGYEDASNPINKLMTEREPVSGFARFHE